MSVQVLVSGALFKAPEQRTSKSGKPFVTATIRAKNGEVTQWWKVIGFSDSAMAVLMRLSDGDALSVQGCMKTETYTPKDGSEPRLSFSVTADHVLSLRQPRRKPPQGEGRSAKQQPSPKPQRAPTFDDAIPF
jgi:single-stranded DNA-binding protein